VKARRIVSDEAGQVRNLPWFVVRFFGRDQPRGVGNAGSVRRRIPL